MNDNIIAVNIPNAVSILIILMAGMLAMAAVRKAMGGKSAPAATSGPVFTGPSQIG